jgi:hypothetical protein
MKVIGPPSNEDIISMNPLIKPSSLKLPLVESKDLNNVLFLKSY